MTKTLKIFNCEPVSTGNIPLLALSEFRQTVIDKVHDGLRIAAFYAVPTESGKYKLICVLADDSNGILQLLSASVTDNYTSITPDCPQAHWFEREIAEQYSIIPQGHPWLKPIRFQTIEPGVTDFFQLHGSEVHEVAVGPVHAGIIEPGHFRFQCHGEDVFHLEISLGYQHRGVERAIIASPQKKVIHYMETAAGDTTVGHTFAYSQTH